MIAIVIIEIVLTKVVNAMPVTILLITLMIIAAFFTQVLIFIPLNFLDLFHIPTWLLLTVVVICFSWFLAE